MLCLVRISDCRLVYIFYIASPGSREVIDALNNGMLSPVHGYVDVDQDRL